MVQLTTDLKQQLFTGWGVGPARLCMGIYNIVVLLNFQQYICIACVVATVLYFFLQVAATDGGSPALSSETLVTVVVLDVNDNPPQFNSTFLNLTIPENEPSDTIIGDFIAVDNDQGLAASLIFALLGDETDR